MVDHFDVLGVTPGADESVVRTRYRELLKQTHPDQGGSREAFMRVKRSYEAIIEGDAEPRARERRSRRPGLTEHGEYLRLTLRGLAEDRALDDIIAPHRAKQGHHRTVAFFEVANVSDRVLPWRGHQNARFIGTDGYMYEGATHLRPHVDQLPPRWKGSDLEVEPGARTNGVVIVEELPPGVAIRRVVYGQHVFAPKAEGGGVEDSERFVFDLPRSVKPMLDRVPF